MPVAPCLSSWLHCFILLLSAMLVACQSGPAIPLTAIPSLSPTNLPVARSTSTLQVEPQDEASIPTPTPQPVKSPTTAATHTAVPSPTVITPTSTPAATATTTETRNDDSDSQPTAVIEGLIGPDNFPPNVNPLTGQIVANPSVLARRPLAIKISNAPAIVRPQAGLSSADLVFEHYAEAGLTRFTAIFYSQEPDLVGSVRSGRLIDLEIPKMYDAAFAYSGASGPVRLLFRDSDFFDRIISPDFAHGGFFRVPDPNKAVEHTLFTRPSNLRFILDERGQNTPPDFQNNMAFRLQPLTSGQPARQLEIGYRGTYVTWAYEAGDGRYYRWTDGTPHLDANTGTQLNFKNIIVLAAHHEDTTIIEDRGGNFSIQIQIWGEGPVSIFRDGQRFDGRWRREDPNHMLTFYDLDGNILPLAPGNSFFQLVPLGFDRLIVTP